MCSFQLAPQDQLFIVSESIYAMQARITSYSVSHSSHVQTDCVQRAEAPACSQHDPSA